MNIRLKSLLFLMFPVVAHACPDFYKQSMRELHSQKQVDLCALVDNKPTLVINTASHCGFTPQFEALEALHKQYAQQGLVVIGFSSDDFYQEAKNEEKAEQICRVKFGVTFTMLAPSSVKGKSANPVFAELARQADSPSWNFNKYLVNSEGKVVQHFGSRVKPQSAELTGAIDNLLAKQ